MDKEKKQEWLKALPQMEKAKDEERQEDRFLAFRTYKKLAASETLDQMQELFDTVEEAKTAGLLPKDSCLKDGRLTVDSTEISVNWYGITIAGDGSSVVTLPRIADNVDFTRFSEKCRNISSCEDFCRLTELLERLPEYVQEASDLFHNELESVLGPSSDWKESIRTYQEKQEVTNRTWMDTSRGEAWKAYQTLVNGFPDRREDIIDILMGADSYALLEDTMHAIKSCFQDNYAYGSGIKIVCQPSALEVERQTSARYMGDKFTVLVEFNATRSSLRSFPYRIRSQEDFYSYVSDLNPEELQCLSRALNDAAEDYAVLEDFLEKAMDTVMEQYGQKDLGEESGLELE